MPSTPSGALDRFRQPEYTGRNRCTPCTAVNLVLAALLAGGTAALVAVLGGRGPAALAGLALFGLFAATIYLRGYLVPGTPRLTKTYLPDRVLRWFEKEPPGTGTGTGAAGTGTGTDAPAADEDAAADHRGPDGELDVESVLQDAGAVTECEGGADLCLSDGFGAAWREQIGSLRDRGAPRDDLAAVLQVDRERLSFVEHGDAFAVWMGGQRVGQWESQAAFLADMAAARELRARYEPWSTLAVADRSTVLNGLRIFLERCPACDGPVSIGHEVVESCCRSVDVVAVTCEGCGARVFEAEQP